MSSVYEIGLDAESDLREIIRSTIRRWGEGQARTYNQALDKCATALAMGNVPYKDLSEIYEGLRVIHCRHHYIFSVVRPQKKAIVIAIFHERMDIITRIKDRLKY